LAETRRSAGAVIVAAGSGLRFGDPGVRKQFREILGAPLLAWTLKPFLSHPAITQTVVVLPSEDVETPPEWIRALPVTLIAGGAERGDSVRAGISAVDRDLDPILVHDGARPLVSLALLTRLLQAYSGVALIPGVRVTDTLKAVSSDGLVLATPDRSGFRAVQTPQVFPREALIEVHRRADQEGVRTTDDAALFEHYGLPVRVVEGDSRNLKVTTPVDLALAEILAGSVSDRP
jgi:2-C-methyl-D-erythritol 4-phosphate cytidylyltransferase